MVFLHATSRAAKMWPEANWRALIGAFARAGFAMLLPWGNADERARSASPPRAAALFPTAAARRARGGHRPASRHRRRRGHDLAAALGTPTVSLFVATDASSPASNARRLARDLRRRRAGPVGR
jgi:heptosyltransferase-1